MTIIKPTIGRKVWFRPNGLKTSIANINIDQYDTAQALDATVVCVWNDRLVNISVIDHGGAIHSVRSCPMRQEGDPEPKGFYCEWMPYQTNQAKKEMK